MLRSWMFYIFLGVSLCLDLGCIGRWRPPSVSVKPSARPTTQPATQPSLARYLQATRYGYWVYERRELPEGTDGPPVRYARKATQTSMIEGVLQDGRILDLKPRHRHPTSQPSGELMPRPHRGFWISFEVDEPLSPVPAELTVDVPSTFTTGVSYRDVAGRHLASGTLTRTATIEGVEAVDVPAGHFDDCLRVRVDLAMKFHWGPTIDWTSYLWFSPEVGEVRRVNRLTGLFLIFWFGSAHEYQLVSHQGQPTATAPAGLPAWSGGAMLLNRTIPRPEIAGMSVEFAKP